MNDTAPGVVGPSMAAAPPPPPPPVPHRRPRVREVSSRFMSPAPAPVSVSSSTPAATDPIKSPFSKHGVSTPIPGEFQARQNRLKTTERRRNDKEGLLTCCAHENIPETIRSLDTPLGSRNKPLISGPTRNKRAVKLFKENGGGGGDGRPETPAVPTTSTSCADRVVASRFRTPTHNFQNQTNARELSVSVGTTDAAKLLQSSGLSSSSQSPKVSRNSFVRATPSINHVNEPPFVGGHDPSGEKLPVSQSLEKVRQSNDSDSCAADSIPIRANKCTGSPFSSQISRTRSLPETRSSMPEGDMLPSLSTRALGIAQPNSSSSNRNVGNKLPSASPCSRSLTLPFSSCENSIVQSFKNGERPSPHVSKPSTSTSTSNMASLCLPPQPTCMRLGVDSRKGRKPSTSHDQVHSLKMLHNHYLQWRFANAKAEASMHGQRREAESKLYSLGVDIADLRDSVKRKRVEVELLRRKIALATIAEAQMPYLDEWSALEEDYSNSLSGSIQALVNSSLRLPVSGNIQVDIKQISEALQSALKTMEMIGTHAERFMPKAEEMDTLISELARVIGGGGAAIEECGDLLFKTYKSQVEDCSLRGHLMQLDCSKKSLQI